MKGAIQIKFIIIYYYYTIGSQPFQAVTPQNKLGTSDEGRGVQPPLVLEKRRFFFT